MTTRSGLRAFAFAALLSVPTTMAGEPIISVWDHGVSQPVGTQPEPEVEKPTDTKIPPLPPPLPPPFPLEPKPEPGVERPANTKIPPLPPPLPPPFPLEPKPDPEVGGAAETPGSSDPAAPQLGQKRPGVVPNPRPTAPDYSGLKKVPASVPREERPQTGAYVLVVEGETSGRWGYLFERYVPFTDDKVHGIVTVWAMKADAPKLRDYIVSTTPFENGDQHGIARTYSSEGKLLKLETFADGKRNGLTQSFNEDGTLQETFRCVDDKKEGLYQKYQSSGYPEMETMYVAGRIQGFNRLYHSNGQLAMLMHFAENEVKHGVSKGYNREGQLVIDAVYKNGTPMWSEKFYDSGTLKEHARYDERGAKHGLVTTYHENGKVAGETTYEHGEVTSTRQFDADGKPIPQ